LAAVALAGVDELYQIGGVAAIGALAFGTSTLSPVDLIAGPGGAWVTEAKRQVFGVTGLDMLAGPSEIVILADRFAPAPFVAADMMAQAEHDPLALSTVISTETDVLRHIRSEVEKRFLPQCRFLKVKDWSAAVGECNRLSPEHLSISVERPERLLKDIRHAGAIFLGVWSPVAAGDYGAGPSHVLPTGQSARFSSGLSVQTFLKRSSLIGFSQASIQKKSSCLTRLAAMEGLTHHAASLKLRKTLNHP
jgi:histidinol dehydrogenase